MEIEHIYDEIDENYSNEYYGPNSEIMRVVSTLSKVTGLNTKVAWAPRDWKYTTKDTGVGNPKKATAEKGKRYIQAAMKEIVSFITDFAKADTLY